METGYPVVFLPGGVLPAEPACAALPQVLGKHVDAVTKDLEVYSGDRPPTDFGLNTEVAGILREANAHGFVGSISSATPPEARDINAHVPGPQNRAGFGSPPASTTSFSRATINAQERLTLPKSYSGSSSGKPAWRKTTFVPCSLGCSNQVTSVPSQ